MAVTFSMALPQKRKLNDHSAEILFKNAKILDQDYSPDKKENYYITIGIISKGHKRWKPLQNKNFGFVLHNLESFPKSARSYANNVFINYFLSTINVSKQAADCLRTTASSFSFNITSELMEILKPYLGQTQYDNLYKKVEFELGKLEKKFGLNSVMPNEDDTINDFQTIPVQNITHPILPSSKSSSVFSPMGSSSRNSSNLQTLDLIPIQPSQPIVQSSQPIVQSSPLNPMNIIQFPQMNPMPAPVIILFSIALVQTPQGPCIMIVKPNS